MSRLKPLVDGKALFTNSLRDRCSPQLCARALDPISRPVYRGPIDRPPCQVPCILSSDFLMLNIRDEHVQRRQHGGSYLLRQRSPLSRLGRQVIRIVLVSSDCEFPYNSSPSPRTMWRTRPFLSHRTTSPGEASVFEDPEGNLIKKRTDSNGHCPNSKTGLFLKIKSLHVLKTLFSPVKLTSCSLFEVLFSPSR